MRLRDIESSDVQSLISDADRAGKSRQTRKHILNTVKGVFKHAKRTRQFCRHYPTEFVVLPKKPAKQRGAITWPQAEAVADRLPKYRLLIRLLVICGPRIGEACTLRRKWVNLSDEFVSVDGVLFPPKSVRFCENWKYYKGGWRYQTLKSQRPRIVPLPRTLVTELALHLAQSRWQDPGHPVSPSPVGKPIDYGNACTRDLKPVGEELGMPWLSWHGFRHAASTLAEAAGITEIDRMAILGHSSESVNRVYAHADVKRLRGSLERLSEGMSAAFGL